MELNAAQVSDENWLNGQELRIVRLENILKELKNKNLLEEIEFEFGIKE